MIQRDKETSRELRLAPSENQKNPEVRNHRRTKPRNQESTEKHKLAKNKLAQNGEKDQDTRDSDQLSRKDDHKNTKA